MTELEMLEQAVQSEAVEAAPGAVQVLPGLSLLPAVVVVQELVNYPDLLKNENSNLRAKELSTSLTFSLDFVVFNDFSFFCFSLLT